MASAKIVTRAALCVSRSYSAASVDGPYTGPVIKTTVPGPKSKALLQELGESVQTHGVTFFTDFEQSRGNYVMDADGNVLMDLFNQIGSLPLGYNHPAIKEAVVSEANLAALITRPALAIFPPISWPELVQSALMPLAPAGLTDVTLMMCGTCSNENAFKMAFIDYMSKQRDEPLTPDSEEYRTAMYNQPPGSPKLSVLSFMGGFHGRALGTLSCTHSKPIHKLDIPAFDWPIAPFPQLRYPLSDFERENEAEERRCLAETEEEIEKAAKGGQPVAAIIVEPIQGEGGDRHASANFFRELQSISKKHGAVFIVDEVQTGCGVTGNFWAHEDWGLPEPADIVTFAKKMMTAGAYHKKALMPKQGYRIFNTWMGDPIRVVMLKAMAEEMRSKNLLAQCRESGRVLLDGLQELEVRYPSQMHSARGKGTFCAFDCHSVQHRDQVLSTLRNKGFNVGGTGVQSVRFRPTLIFEPRHATLFLQGLEDTLKELNNTK